MHHSVAFASLSLAAFVAAQQIGTNTAETHPSLSWEKCTTSGGCTAQSGNVVLDSNWRWVHNVGGYTNCYTGNAWDATLCPDPTTCATNCALDGADYSGTYGITTSGNALTLDFVTTGSNTNVGSRVYLTASNTAYQMFKPLNQEFTFDVDVSQLPCGLNGALYFSEMSADGGLAAYSGNKAGAQYGTGYCDSQCPSDIKFINGQANLLNWTATGANTGTGMYGTCCNEMDIWEANSISAAYTPHPCSVVGQTRCSGAQCGHGADRHNGVCDPDGCDFNSYRMGVTNFYGPSMTIDTTQKITVVTQFITADGTATGALTEIRRLYVQNGLIYYNSYVNQPNIPAVNSITDAFCTAQKTEFGDDNSFAAQGGITAMGQSLARGVVLVLSIWDDSEASMLWLDSDYPTTGNPATPGIARGTCATTSGVPATVESQSPNAKVVYSNIRFGDIGSTYTGTIAPNQPSGSGATTTGPTTTSSHTTTTSSHTTTTSSHTTTTSSHTTTTSSSHTTTTASHTTTGNGATQTHWGQCAGTGYTGPTVCASPYTCQYSNPYYSQCL